MAVFTTMFATFWKRVGPNLGGGSCIAFGRVWVSLRWNHTATGSNASCKQHPLNQTPNQALRNQMFQNQTLQNQTLQSLKLQNHNL